MNIFKKAEGFTLVEIMIVVGIIAILAGIFLVGAGRFRNSANDAKIRADVNEIVSFEELYYTKNGVYDTSTNLSQLAGTFTLPVHPDSANGGNFTVNVYNSENYVCGRMMDASGYNDPSNTSTYQAIGTRQYYCLPISGQ